MKPAEIRELAMAFQRSRILLTAFELDIFTVIDDKKMTAGSVASVLNLNKAATERLLNALTALKLLKKENGSYSNSADSQRFLSKNSPGYLAGLGHSGNLWHSWSQLTGVLRTGIAAQDTEINERGDEWLEAFIQAMHERGKIQAPAQLSHIDLRDVESVLDVGGGSGCYCMEFLKRKPDLITVVFDLPNVVPVSEKIIAREGYTGKIHHHAGDYTTDDLPGGFDLVFLSAIIHSNSFETNRQLIGKCFKALKHNGTIVIQDWIMNNSKTEPEQGAVFSINMLVGTDEGDCYSENEIKSWLEEAGFMFFKKKELESGLSQMSAKKM